MYNGPYGSDTWYQVVVPDEEALIGSSVKQFVQALAEWAPAEHVRVITADWACEKVWHLHPLPDPCVITTAYLLTLLETVIQIEWGRFFFYRSAERAAAAPHAYVPEMLSWCDYGLVCADNTYFYVYTRDSALVQKLEEAYITEPTKKGTLDQLDYLY